jgi:hypothetical protein
MSFGSAHYFYQALHGKIRPHFFSCLVWTLVTTIVFAGLIAEHAGLASIRTALLAVMLAVVSVVSFRNGLGYVSRLDICSLALSLAAIPVWIATKSPDASILWVLCVEVAGTTPALRKAWTLPHEEGIIGPLLNAASSIFALLAVPHPSFAVMAYFGGWAVILAGLATITAYRRIASPLSTEKYYVW